jgi:hypothetical protein
MWKTDCVIHVLPSVALPGERLTAKTAYKQLNIQAAAAAAQQQPAAGAGAGNQAGNQAPAQNFARTPQLSLRKFDGSDLVHFNDWLTEFQNTIGATPGMPNVVKQSHLRSFLGGKPLDDALEITLRDEGLQDTYNYLTSAYGGRSRKAPDVIQSFQNLEKVNTNAQARTYFQTVSNLCLQYRRLGQDVN